MDASKCKLRTSMVGALPIVRHFMGRLGLDELLARHVPATRLGRRPKVAHGQVLGIMITNVLLSREPLYGVPEWAGSFLPELFGFDDLDAKVLNDDRIARALDRLFHSGQAPTFMTAVVVRAVKEFEIDLSQIHNDTTTVTFSGAYEGQKDAKALKRPPLITFGHNKDHRPDLKQLVYALTVSADGAVPVHYRCYDGNVTDDQTHRDTWSTVRDIRGGPDFLYVADSKLCTRENMRFIDERGGRFLTVMPRSRKEDDDFRAYIQTNLVPWEEVSRKKNRRKKDAPDEVYEAIELDVGTSEGYRLIWYRSTEKARHDLERRQRKIMRARQRLEQLADRSGAHAFRSVEAAEKAAERVLEDEGAKRWLACSCREEPQHEIRQDTPGRPGPKTRYRRVAKKPCILFHISENIDTIQEDARCDGLFAMVTNDRVLDAKNLLAAYKYQPFLEKRNEQLKSVLSVAPIFLKKPERVAALLFLYFLAVLIFALIEREIRRAMRAKRIDSLPLYPEGRPCSAPTADFILRAFENHRRSELVDEDDNSLKVFHDDVSAVGRHVLEMLHVDRERYGLRRK